MELSADGLKTAKHPCFGVNPLLGLFFGLFRLPGISSKCLFAEDRGELGGVPKVGVQGVGVLGPGSGEFSREATGVQYGSVITTIQTKLGKAGGNFFQFFFIA